MVYEGYLAEIGKEMWKIEAERWRVFAENDSGFPGAFLEASIYM